MTAFIFIVAVVGFIIGLAKGGIGGVLGVLVVPLLAVVMPVTHAISLALPLLMIGDWFSIWAFWKQWDTHYIKLLLPLAVVGVIVGTILLKLLPDATLRPILGVFTLVFIVYRLLDYRIRALDYHPHEWHGHLAGVVTGLGSALANNGTPPFTAFMLLQEINPTAFVATGALFFTVLNLVKLPGLVIAGLFNLNDFLRVLWVIPLIPLGVWISRWLVVRMNRVAFERFMLFVLFLTSLYLIFVH